MVCGVYRVGVGVCFATRYWESFGRGHGSMAAWAPLPSALDESWVWVPQRVWLLASWGFLASAS